MVKDLFLRVLVMCGIACVAPAPLLEQPSYHEEVALNPLEPEDPAVRSERSTNLSFVAGTSRKIQMFVKNRHLQILPDGTVNGTTDDTSIFTILQRYTVGIGLVKIQGTATCQYLCMDVCGFLYGSKEFVSECVFNETIEQHYYNTYSSTKYSNDKRTLYLALNRKGQPRKVMLRAKQQLGKLSSYTRVLTRTVSPERTEELLHHMRHHGHMCLPSVKPNQRLSITTADPLVEYPRCRKRKKRKKKKRKCSDIENDQCVKRQNKKILHPKHAKKCEHDEGATECQRDIKKKKNSDKNEKLSGGAKKKRLHKKGFKKHVNVIVSSEATVNTEEESTPEEDYYGLDSTTREFDDFINSTPSTDLTESSQPL